MADFCSLCGYGDLNIEEIYNKYLKPDIRNDVATMTDEQFATVGVHGICEHCGIISIGVNNKYEVYGGYGEKHKHKIGDIDKETLELIILKDDPKYSDQRKRMNEEFVYSKLEWSITEAYCLRHNKTTTDLVDDDYEKITKLYEGLIQNLQ